VSLATVQTWSFSINGEFIARVTERSTTIMTKLLHSGLRAVKTMGKKRKKVRLEVKRVDHQYFGLYAGDHLIYESPKRKILEEMKRHEFKEDVASNH